MKVGIYAPFASGDLITSTPVLQYKNMLWPGARIVWFVIEPAHRPNIASRDLLGFNPLVDEVRVIPPEASLLEHRDGHATNSVGHAISVPDACLGRLRTRCEYTKDLDLCYFPAPWANCDKLDDKFAFIHRGVFKYDASLEVHPCLFFSEDEDGKAKEMVSSLPFRKTIMLETRFTSGQSPWDDAATVEVTKTCRNRLGDCNFVFSSPGQAAKFAGKGVIGCDLLTIRQCIPVHNMCHLFLGSCSAVSSATCSWSAKPIPRLDMIYRENISSKYFARGAADYATSLGDFCTKLDQILCKGIL
jgi:hypothetical protein